MKKFMYNHANTIMIVESKDSLSAATYFMKLLKIPINPNSLYEISSFTIVISEITKGKRNDT